MLMYNPNSKSVYKVIEAARPVPPSIRTAQSDRTKKKFDKLVQRNLYNELKYKNNELRKENTVLKRDSKKWEEKYLNEKKKFFKKYNQCRVLTNRLRKAVLMKSPKDRGQLFICYKVVAKQGWKTMRLLRTVRYFLSYLQGIFADVVCFR